MILKGSQRGSGQNLAAHLMKTEDNEHLELHQMRGFASDNLKDAFKEIEAISRGTKCQQYLFSLSLSPPEGASVPVAEFDSAIDRVEERLGLQGQPRAIVFHEKESRRHAHCVWSRIDAETMTARHLSLYKTRLMSLSRDLYLENGWKMPRGLEAPGERSSQNFTLAEWQQAKRQGMDPRWIKQALQDYWSRSDSLPSLERALGERGFFLARGDKRGFVVLDHNGEVYSLPRMLDVKTKDVRARLGDGDGLSSVADKQKMIGERMTPAIRQHIADARTEFEKRSANLGSYKAELTQLHRKARVDLDDRQKLDWESETRARAARLPKGLRGVWHRITGKYQEMRRANESEARESRERQAQERQVLIEKQIDQRKILQNEIRDLRHEQAERLWELRKDVGRFLSFTRHQEVPGLSQDAGLGLRLER